jgi:hypothetical protein
LVAVFEQQARPTTNAFGIGIVSVVGILAFRIDAVTHIWQVISIFAL